MRFTLKEYQEDAVAKVLTALALNRNAWHSHGGRSAFALSSATGSGKTVIAAAVIEALIHGSDEFDFEPDPTAVVLWVSKDPSLNEQTRGRFIECADRIPAGDLVLLDKTYAEESLQVGTVYFINPDKLSVSADFVKHTDARSVTFWEILSNTINTPDKTLYLILDEAHEGMRTQSEAEQTIVQRIINGNGASPAVPIVWGISATVQRFDEAMAEAADRIKWPNVEIDPKDVQDSGLLKNSLVLDIPDEPGDFVTTMIRDATIDFVDVCERWDAYGEREGLENPVIPLLVVQIPNKAEGESDTEEGRTQEDEQVHLVLETIRHHWAEMPSDCVAHVLGDRATIEVGAYVIPKVAPQDIEHDHRIRVLIAKDAVSTGWDCPRAEVLASLRPGVDDTYVTQLLGRMVRTPLAQTTSEDRLNSASCYLPRFDQATAKRVAEEIMGMREPEGPQPPAVGRVLLKPVTIAWNPTIGDDVRGILEGLPSFAKPTASPRPIKRLLRVAQALAQDDLVPKADEIAHEALFEVLDGILSREDDAIAEQARRVLTADVLRIVAERGNTEVSRETTQRAADMATVNDALRHLRRQITTSVVNRYLSRNMQSAIDDALKQSGDPNDIDISDVRARVAALGLIETPTGEMSVQAEIENAADALTRHWLTTKSEEIKGLPDSRQPTYEAIRDMAREPESVPIEIKTDERVDTVDTDFEPLPTAKKHVLSTSAGDFPLDVKLNRWERAAISNEVEDESIVAWYRNPSAAGPHSLRIPYEDGEGWKSMQPDLVCVARNGDGELRASIIDPHGAHQGDALPKLKALAEFSEEQGGHFDRIVSVGVETEIAGQNVLLGIDMTSSRIRRAVYESEADAESVKAIYREYGERYASIDQT